MHYVRCILQALEQPQASSTRTSDYRFVYLGPQGSWTPLHSDVLRSYSWSANVAGKKRSVIENTKTPCILQTSRTSSYVCSYVRLASIGSIGCNELPLRPNYPAKRGPNNPNYPPVPFLPMDVTTVT